MDRRARIIANIRASAPRARAAAGLLIWLAVANPASADDYVSRHELQDLLRQNEFSALEKTLDNLERDYAAGRISDHVIDHAYYAFSIADPDLANRFDAWIAAKPRSHHALLGRGIYRRNLGWVFRGDAYYARTPRHRIDMMVNQFRLAEQDMIAALKIKPNSGVAFAYLIEMQIAAGTGERRDTLLRHGLQADPDSLAIRRHYFFGLTPWWGGGTPTVSDPRYPVKLPNRLRLFARDMERDAAASPRLRPLLGYLDYTVALMLNRDGRYEDAAKFFARAIAISDYWQFHGEAGHNFGRMKRYDDAIASYSRTLELRPDMQGYLKARAIAYGAKRQFDKALADLDAALALDPKDPDILLLKGRALQHIGRREEALETLNAAMLYGEFDDEVWFARGTLYLYQFSDPKRALSDLKRARELAPNKPPYLFHYFYARILSWT